VMYAHASLIYSEIDDISAGAEGDGMPLCKRIGAGGTCQPVSNSIIGVTC
jgi:hypothetical protein